MLPWYANGGPKAPWWAQILYRGFVVLLLVWLASGHTRIDQDVDRVAQVCARA